MGTPFKVIVTENCKKVRTAITILRPNDTADYALTGHMLAETKKRLSAWADVYNEVVMTYELVVNDKRQNLQVVKRQDLPVEYAAEFVEVGISLIEMDSGMALDLGDRERWAPIVLELVAAAEAYYQAYGFETKVYFKENLRQYGRYWKGKAAVGIDYGVQRLVDMLRALAETSYGNPKFFEIQDTEGQVSKVVFSMGARTSATWEGIAELGLMQDTLHGHDHGIRCGKLQRRQHRGH